MSKSKYPEPVIGALVVNDKGKILLIKSPKWKDVFVVPGGHIKLGESIEQAVKREIKEEVGLDVEVGKMLLVLESIFSDEFHEKRHFIFLDYLCRAKSKDVVMDDKEAKSFVWVKPEDALELNLNKTTREFIKAYLNFLER